MGWDGMHNDDDYTTCLFSHYLTFITQLTDVEASIISKIGTAFYF